jgi:5'-nucleotidase
MIVYVDMDDVLCDYSTKIELAKINSPEIEFPQSTANFFRQLNPIIGAISSIEILRATRGIDLYILTAPSTKNPLSYTEKRLWVEDHFDYEFTKRLIICSNKGLLKGDILIDDHISGRGQEIFEGKLIHFGSCEFPNWESVMKKIL